jgi:hypothetical protein
MHPQVQSDRSHDVFESSAGTSTVGRCDVHSLPSTCGRAEPPQLGGAGVYTSHEPYTHTHHNTVTEGSKRHTLSLSTEQQQRHVCCSSVTLTGSRESTMHPQVQPNGGHDVTGSGAGTSTVDRCPVHSLPSTRGRAEPPQIGGVDCIRNGSNESYTHHITHSH